jgi:hypothetical protein
MAIVGADEDKGEGARQNVIYPNVGSSLRKHQIQSLTIATELPLKNVRHIIQTLKQDYRISEASENLMRPRSGTWGIPFTFLYRSFIG